MDRGHVFLLNGGIKLIALDSRHHDQRIGVAVEFEKRKDRIEHGCDEETVGANHTGVDAVSGKMGVGEDDLVAMAHFGKSF